MPRTTKKKKPAARRHPAWLLIPVILLAVGLSDCPKKAPPPPDNQGKADPPSSAPSTNPATADIPLDPQRKVDPLRVPGKPPSPAPERVAARYILIKFIGAKNATRATRTRADARARAERLVKIARLKGEDFVALAQLHSEVEQADRGKQAIFSRGSMLPTFEKAAFGLGLEQISHAVETEFGFYVIMRDHPQEYSTAHILVQYKGAEKAPGAVSRTKAEAQERAGKVQGYATKEKANFAVLAERYSDSPSKVRGGVLRPIVPEQMPKEYKNYVEAVQALEVGQVSPVVETPFGFHVIKRLKLVRITVSHILIAYNDSDGEPREPRSKGEARSLAGQVVRKARAADANFTSLAKELSDDLDSAEKGGALGSFARGMLEPKFEQMAFGLKVGRVSDVVQTRFGYHVILRTQ